MIIIHYIDIINIQMLLYKIVIKHKYYLNYYFFKIYFEKTDNFLLAE